MSDDKPKTFPLRRAVTGIAIFIFLIIYIFIVIEIGKHIPEKPLFTLVYYGIAGVSWGIPLLPLLSWAEGRKPVKKNRAQ